LTLRIWDILTTGNGVVEEVDTPVHTGLKAVKLSGNLNNKARIMFYLPEIPKGRLTIYIRSDDFGTAIDILFQVTSSKAFDLFFDPSDKYIKWYDGSSFHSIVQIDPSGKFHELIVEWDVDNNTCILYWDGEQYSAGLRDRSDTPFIHISCTSGSGSGEWFIDDIKIEDGNGIIFEDDFEPLITKIKGIADFVNSVKDKNYPEEVFSYLATGDETFLNNAKNAITNLSPSATDREFGYALISASIIALIDPNFVSEVKRLADYAVNNQKDNGLWDNGTGYCLPTQCSAIVEGLLWAYKVTGDSKYLNSAKKYLDKIEEIRNNNNGWIPRKLNLDGTIAQSYPRYYDEMGSHAVLCYFVYELTGDETYLNRAKAIIDVVVNNLWDGNAFLYSPDNNIYEIELSWFDPILMMMNYNADKASADLLYRMLDKDKGTAYTDGHLHGIEVSNDLVKHGVNTDGSDYTNHQSLFPPNKGMPIALLYYDVFNNVDLSKNIEVTIRALERHRKSNGYIGAIDPYSFLPDSFNPNPVHDHAFVYPFLALLSLIKPPSIDELPKHYGAYNFMFYKQMKFNYSERKLIGFFKAGTYTFYLGTKPVTHTFDDDGNYVITFSDDCNDIESVSSLAKFTIIEYTETVTVAPRQTFTVNVTVKNEGGSRGTCTVRLIDHNGNTVSENTVSVDPNSNVTVSLSGIAPDVEGSYTWKIVVYNNATGEIDDSKSITVNVSSAQAFLTSILSTLYQFLPLIIGIVIIIMLISAFVVLLRRE